MKSGNTSRKFPVSLEEWEEIIARAPGVDRPPTPEEEAGSDGVVVKQGGYPAVRAALQEKRGRSMARKPKKMLLSVRYSPEVVEYFRATGEGWQARMNAALKEWIKAHPPT
ncbi:MAG: BrnA antitoxin family protein [Methylococcales bacterium]